MTKNIDKIIDEQTLTGSSIVKPRKGEKVVILVVGDGETKDINVTYRVKYRPEDDYSENISQKFVAPNQTNQWQNVDISQNDNNSISLDADALKADSIQVTIDDNRAADSIESTVSVFVVH